MQISLQHISIHPLLKEHIDKLWVFENSHRIPDASTKMIVPDGKVKLILPFRNGLAGQRQGMYELSRQHQITLIGINDVPFVVDAERDAPSGIIGVEFTTIGAYRFFNLRQSDLRNRIFKLEDLLGKAVHDIELRIAETEKISNKITLLQQYLLQQFARTEPDEVFEFSVHQIKKSNGSISIGQLEKMTGYSSRWLNMKFEERIGMSPKSLSAVVRFQAVYQALLRHPESILRNKAYYDLYYDQSHFIKEFKRFTGKSPAKFQAKISEFGKIFSKQ
jgi:AraC-like DNA-binding protein